MNRVVFTKNKLLNRFIVFSLFILGPWNMTFTMRNFGPLEFENLSLEFLQYLWLFLFVSYISYVFGFLLTKESGVIKAHSATRYSRARQAIFLFAILFPVVAAIDFFIFKGAAITEIVAQREAEHLTGPRNSVIGALVALLSGSPPLAFVLMKESPIKSKVFSNAAYFVIALGFASMFLSGGRNAFFISILFIIVYNFFFVKGERDSFKRKLTFLTFFFFFFFFSMKMFVDRFEEQGFDVSFMLDYLSSEYGIDVVRIDTQNSFFIAAYSIYVYLTFYITHSLSYLNDYFALSYSPMLSGSYNFPILARVFDLVFGSSGFELGRESMLVEGVYLTMPGSFYLDFGYGASILFMGLFSFCFGYLVRNLGNLVVYQKLVMSFMAVCLVFSPIYSVIGMANGFSVICMLCIVLLCYVRI